MGRFSSLVFMVSVTGLAASAMLTNRVGTWDAVTKRVCSVEANTDSLVTDGWSLITNNLPPAGAWTDTVHGADAFINNRLGVRRV